MLKLIVTRCPIYVTRNEINLIYISKQLYVNDTNECSHQKCLLMTQNSMWHRYSTEDFKLFKTLAHKIQYHLQCYASGQKQ